jgi:hypothetical protein
MGLTPRTPLEPDTEGLAAASVIRWVAWSPPLSLQGRIAAPENTGLDRASIAGSHEGEGGVEWRQSRCHVN